MYGIAYLEGNCELLHYAELSLIRTQIKEITKLLFHLRIKITKTYF